MVAFPDGCFDRVYVDGNHSYAFVKRDLELYLPKIRSGGFLTGDDYLFDRCPEGGPKRAVTELAASGLVEIVSIKHNQFILRQK